MQAKEPRHHTKHQIFYSRCLIKNKVCNLIIDNDSCKNIVSTTLVDYLKLETELHPYLHCWVDQEGSLHPCNESLSYPCFNWQVYQYSVTYDVVDMDACRILLGRPWQHNVDATYQAKKNIYMFTWEGKRIAMKPIPPPPKPTKERESKFISICNQSEFLMESK